MSQYRIDPKLEGWRITVGWDPSTRAFFATVFEPRKETDNGHDPVPIVNITDSSPYSLAERIKDYAIVSMEIINLLLTDGLEVSQDLAPLQILLRETFREKPDG